MKIYINNIRIENTLGISVTAEGLCSLMDIPKDNAIVSDEDMVEIPFGVTFYVQDKDRFFIVRKSVIGG